MFTRLTRAELQELVLKAVDGVMEGASSHYVQADESTSLWDLGADSLDYVSIGMAIEEALATRGIDFSLEAADVSVTSQDTVITITEALAEYLSF